ncbi:TolC family protein [Thiomicrorhabdus sp.]|uniref:TolC family protein n=1 Tax=Thiomicrorhabdus sp. TaxID=2039724 RepID=UPI00356208A7
MTKQTFSGLSVVPAKSGLRRIGLALALCFGTSAQAELPNPLTLDYVLSTPVAELPQMSLQQAKLNKLQSQMESQDSKDGLQLNLVGRLAWRDYAEKTEDFHLAAIHANQTLYDFDRNQNLTDALKARSDAENILYTDAEQQLKLQLMQGFFNVLLADFQYRIDNEDMAVAYVALDKAKDRLELKRISDVDYLKIENDYEKILVKRKRAEFNQLKTRIELANLLGQPEARPDELTFPKLEDYAKRKADDTKLEELQQQALEQNTQVNALKQQLQAAQLTLQSQQAGNKPHISLDAWAGKLSSYPEIREGNWNIGIMLDMPLYDGGLISAKVSEAKADIQAVQAKLRLLEQNLRDEVADLYFQLKMLQAEKNQNQIFGDYADLYLDYSRALYENETATDLGDSMVRLSEANYEQVAWKFKQALLWAKLDYLMGKEVFSAAGNAEPMTQPENASSEPMQGNQS